MSFLYTLGLSVVPLLFWKTGGEILSLWASGFCGGVSFALLANQIRE